MFEPRSNFLFNGISFLLSQLVYLRRYCYQKKILPSQRAGALVVVVGNLQLGGSGKTPLVAYLANKLHQLPIRVGIVCRGQGAIRKIKKPQQVYRHSQATQIGDEALWLKQTLDLPTFVGVNRHKACQALLQKYPQTEVILLDDGLQHYTLKKDISIVMPLPQNSQHHFVFPKGWLREPIECLQQTGFEPDFLLKQSDIDRQLSGFEAIFTHQKYSLDEVRGFTSIVISGIAHPQNLIKELKSMGLNIAQTLNFKDHHHYQFKDFVPVKQWLQSQSIAPSKCAIITTSKDAVKWSEEWFEGFNSCHMIKAQLSIKLKSEVEEAILATIKQKLLEHQSKQL